MGISTSFKECSVKEAWEFKKNKISNECSKCLTVLIIRKHVFDNSFNEDECSKGMVKSWWLLQELLNDESEYQLIREDKSTVEASCKIYTSDDRDCKDWLKEDNIH